MDLKGHLKKHMPNDVLDGGRVILDFIKTRELQKNLSHYAEKENLRTISEFNINDYKTSDKIFVLASGSSVNRLTDKHWEHISGHDSIGFNFWFIHNFVPTFYMFEAIPERTRYEKFNKLLALKKDLYKNTPFFCQYKHFISSSMTLQRLNSLPVKNTYLFISYNPYICKTSSGLVLRLLLSILRQFWSSSAKYDWMIHLRASLSVIVCWAAISGYKEIVFVGVDLNDTKYFWEEFSGKYPITVSSGQKGTIHGTVDPHISDSLTIDVCLDIFDKVVLRKKNIKLYVANEDSRLYPRFPLYEFS